MIKAVESSASSDTDWFYDADNTKSNMIIIYKGRELLDSYTMDENGIKDGDSIEIINSKDLVTQNYPTSGDSYYG